MVYPHLVWIGLALVAPAVLIGRDADDDGNEFYPYWIIGGPCEPIT